MKRIVIFCALCALWGCKEANVPQTEPIALYYSTAEQSKTDLLTQGEEIGVFASIEGTERYFLDNTKYIVEADGRSLSTAPAVYYPEAKQAVTFTAYLPFGGTWDGGVGTFSVPSDQTTAAALKQADLCWATASSTPVAAPVALEFRHQMARLLITTNEPTEKIAIPNAFSGGILDIKTGTFTNTLRSEVFTTGNELIVPAQTLSRLVLTVSGVEYTFEGAMVLESAKTTSISLTLNATTHTATLAGSSTTDWTGSATTGNTTQAAANTLTIHWPKCHPQSGSVDEVVLRIKDQATNTTADYTVSSGITYADQTFTVPFASADVFYPYTIEDITLYQSGTWLHRSMNIVGPTITKRGACVIGVRQPLNPPAEADYIKVGNLYWAKGNLIAVNNNECRIGAPADYGLYFQCGSLVGWTGGVNGNGVGQGQPGLDKVVWPMDMGVNKPNYVWQKNDAFNISTLNNYYFNYTVAPWATPEENIRNFNVPIAGDAGTGTLATGRYARQGVGDPCTYYLGGTWRLPTTTEHSALFGKKLFDDWLAWTTPETRGLWVAANQVFAGIAGPGAWFGSGLNAGVGTPTAANLFVPASGSRVGVDGSHGNTAIYGSFQSSVLGGNTGIHYLLAHELGILQGNSFRADARPVRCVSN